MTQNRTTRIRRAAKTRTGKTIATGTLFSTLFLVSTILQAFFLIGANAAGDCERYRIDKLDIESRCNKGSGPSDSVLTIMPGFTSVLTPDCKVVINGCAMVNKDINTSITNFKLKHGFIVFRRNDKDVCEEIKTASGDAKTVVDNLGLSNGCPFSAGKYCYDHKVINDVSKYAKDLSMAVGSTYVEVESKHNDNTKSCLRYRIDISKK